MRMYPACDSRMLCLMKRSQPASRRRAAAGIPLLAGALAMLGGCSHLPRLHWPWHKNAAPPEPVQELALAPEAGTSVASFPQYWKRNTLVLDLKDASGSGGITARPQPNKTWPVRLALRVTPGTIGMLEVRADQRMLLPIATGGGPTVDLELPPGVYGPKTDRMIIRWGPQAGTP